eukprot:CAMPEP_0198547366 /NCGR_PEP_ID=MMETSP1462-20131121/67514_1 /TAXON_ID=1333877 /ORGANISM="Brandtodinium nutriculum, Strain RCC3387" /LENGTH=282 /DNA_ID=CAMNT_0044277851 /DNA_START=218 /DNA_END=1063 /DNA_ORIENTATION=-
MVGGFHMEFVVATECQNPNPYSVILESTKGVQVYLGAEMIPVARVEDIPLTSLPAKGSGFIDAHVDWRPPQFSQIGPLLSAVFKRGPIPIWVENEIALKIDIDFLFAHIKMRTSFTKDCGFQVKLKMMPPKRAKVGPFACAESFDQLTLPPPDTAFHGELPLYQAHLAESEIKAGTIAKDVGLGTAMASGFGIGTVLLLLAIFGFIRASHLIFCNPAENKRRMRGVAANRKARSQQRGRSPGRSSAARGKGGGGSRGSSAGAASGDEAARARGVRAGDVQVD